MEIHYNISAFQGTIQQGQNLIANKSIIGEEGFVVETTPVAQDSGNSTTSVLMVSGEKNPDVQDPGEPISIVL